MKKCNLLLSLATVFCLFTGKTQASLQNSLEKIINSTKQPVHIGVVIREANTGKILYGYHNQYLFSPASVQKVLTATAALLYLGSDFRYKTILATTGEISNNTLHGNVIIKFTGDPELTLDDIQQLLRTLASKGIKNIDGNIYLDKSAYDDVIYPPGRLWDDLSYSYAAPLTAININKNKFVLRLVPGNKIGDKPTLSVNIPNNVVHFTNYITTTQHYHADCPITIYSDMHNGYVLHGCLNKLLGRQARVLAIRDTVPYAQAVIQKSLNDEGIHYSGKVTLGYMNNQYKIIGTHYSVPLPKLLKHMLKKSDNLISDSFVKQMGYQASQIQGNWENGKKILQQTLAKATGVNFKQSLIDDGAGLSRYNLLTPNQLTQVLDFIYSQPQSFRHLLIDALPIAGIDGTLVGRMYNEAAEKRVRAKTGSMTGVSALTGYIYTRHLGVLTFAIMINGFIGKNHRYKYLEDRICQFLANYPGDLHG